MHHLTRPSLVHHKNCLWRRMFSNLKYVTYNKRFAGYRWLKYVQEHLQSQKIISEIIVNVRGLQGEITVITEYFNQQTFSLMSWTRFIIFHCMQSIKYFFALIPKRDCEKSQRSLIGRLTFGQPDRTSVGTVGNRLLHLSKTSSFRAKFYRMSKRQS